MKKIHIYALLSLISLMVVASFIMAAEPPPDLRQAVEKKNPKAVQKIVDGLVSQNNEKAYDELAGVLSTMDSASNQECYHIILMGITGFSERSVIEKITGFILSNKAKVVAQDLLFRFKGNHSLSKVPLLAALLEKGSYEMQAESAYQLGNIYAKESIQALAEFLRKNTDKTLIKPCITSLSAITGLEERNYPEWWVQWWDENKNKDAGALVHPKVASGFVDHVGDYRSMKEVEKLEKEKIIVITQEPCPGKGGDGNYDHIERVLERLGIPHTVIGKQDIEKPDYSLEDKWALVINCTLFKPHCDCPTCKPGGDKNDDRLRTCTGCDKHIQHETRLSDAVIKKITHFVETGGYLFTEDLAIEEVLERAFRGYITHSRVLPDQVVKIMPAPGAGLHPYLKYVFESPPEMQDNGGADPVNKGTISVKPGDFRAEAEWKIDDKSPDIKVLNKAAVTVLITSPGMAKKNNVESAVAVTFGHSEKGRVSTGNARGPSYAPGGRVLHVMSHFGKQQSKLDEFALQNLIVNFFEELNSRRPKESSKK